MKETYIMSNIYLQCKYLMKRPTFRTSYLQNCISNWHSVCPVASRSRQQASHSLLRKHSYSMLLLLMISVYLIWITVKPPCAGVSHCRGTSPHAVRWARSPRIRTEQMFPSGLAQQILPFRPSSPPDHHLPIEITCVYCTNFLPSVCDSKYRSQLRHMLLTPGTPAGETVFSVLCRTITQPG
jgi:hypothetical protein